MGHDHRRHATEPISQGCHSGSLQELWHREPIKQGTGTALQRSGIIPYCLPSESQQQALDIVQLGSFEMIKDPGERQLVQAFAFLSSASTSQPRPRAMIANIKSLHRGVR